MNIPSEHEIILVEPLVDKLKIVLLLHLLE
jgi:hypothetical protein